MVTHAGRKVEQLYVDALNGVRAARNAEGVGAFDPVEVGHETELGHRLSRREVKRALAAQLLVVAEEEAVFDVRHFRPEPRRGFAFL